MFKGTTSHNLDNKGRFAIPSKYRPELIEHCSGNLVVTLNNTKEKCLWLYSQTEWEEIEKKIVGLSSFNDQHRNVKRFVLGYAHEVELDGSGRILLPKNLRELAMMNQSIELVGQGNKFEIWSSELLEAKRAEWLESMDFSDISPELEKLSL